MCSDVFACQRWIWITGTSDSNGIGQQSRSNLSDEPATRTGCVGWQMNADLFLFGGYSTNNQYLNDLWRYNTSDQVWTWLAGNSDQSPAARMASTGWSFDQNLFLFGGFHNNKYLNDLWTFNSSTHKWTKISGSDGYDQTGHYGTKGVKDSQNYPGARSAATLKKRMRSLIDLLGHRKN